jgi:hypothetical protein
MKINIFKDTIDIKEAKKFDSLLLFVLEKMPDLMLHQAVIITSNKLEEINKYVDPTKLQRS